MKGVAPTSVFLFSSCSVQSLKSYAHGQKDQKSESNRQSTNKQQTLIQASAMSVQNVVIPAVQRSSQMLHIVKPQIIGAVTRKAAKKVLKKSVICQPCTSSDRDGMVDFMAHQFVTREPLMQSLGATPTNSRMFVEHWIDEALVHNASFLARDSETGKICGVRLNAVGPSSGVELENDFGYNLNLIPKFLHHMEQDVPKILGTDLYMRHVAICVEPGVAQCGIATELMKASVRFAMTNGLKNMAAMCSWRLPYSLAKKVGFRCINKVSYADYAQLIKSEGPKAMKPFLKLAESEGAAHVMVRDV